MELFFPMLGLAAIAVLACVFWAVVTITIGIVCRLRRKTWPTCLKAVGIWTAAYVLLIGVLYAGFAALLSTGVSIISTAPRDALVGTYEAIYEDCGRYTGHEVLILRVDGTYGQEYTARNGRTFTNKGKWTTDHMGSGTFVNLEDAIQPGESMGKSLAEPKRQYASFPVNNFFGSITLTIDDDLGLSYVRVSESTAEPGIGRH